MTDTLRDAALETDVLDAMMASERVCAVAVQELSPADFAHSRQRLVFEAIVSAYRDGRPTDPTGIAAELRRLGKSETIKDLAGWVGSSVPAMGEAHVREVRSLGQQRRLREAGARIIDIATGPGGAEEKLAEAQSVLDAATGVQRSGVYSASELADEVLGIMEQMAQGAMPGIVPTGLHDLDALLNGGLWPGHLVILGARPSVGKTALAANVALRAMRAGTGVLFCSLEMSAAEIAARWLADDRSRPLVRMDFSAMNEFANRLAAMPVRLTGSPASVASIRADALLQARDGIGLVVVDYVQLLTGSRRESRVLEVGEYARGLKILARELNVPILLLSQLNRSSEKENRRPTLSDLRDSGELEQHADDVILLHREFRSTEAEAIVAKQRQGEQGKVALVYQAELTRFVSKARAA